MIDDIEDPFIRRAAHSAVHVRRYLPFYVLGLVWAVSLASVAVIQRDGRPRTAVQASDAATAGGQAVDGGGGGGSSGSAAGEAGVGVDGQAAGTVDTSGAAGAGGAGSSSSVTGGGKTGSTARTSATPAGSARAALSTGGKARSGVECSTGVRQIPLSTYATQCTALFTGDNGGATYRGVTKDKIRIVRREFPDTANSQAVEAVGQQAGAASEEDAKMVRDVFINYFNKSYELYGRQVEWVDYESQNGNSTDEAQSKGREGACADATLIVNELKAFAVAGGGDQFSECAADRKMVTFAAAAYFPEQWYQKVHPYAYAVAMECERISYQVGEYIDKRLAVRKAQWAGDVTLQQSTRKFGMYIPDNDGYQRCGNVMEQLMKKGKANGLAARYNYQLDVSRFPDQAAQAMVQFKAAGVTTVMNTCDPISMIFLTQSASSQGYHPEWYIIGVALQDTDNLARLYDQQQVDGHLFGMSQLGPTQKIIGPNSEPGILYKKLTGKTIPDGTDGSYFGLLVHTYNLLQAAGPILTPDAIASGLGRISVGGAPNYPVGYWSFHDGPDGTAGKGDHTEIDDSREVYWMGQETAPDGKAGTFLETYGGKRFRNGEWPAEPPPIYPKK